MLVRIGGVVLLGDVVTEHEVGESLEAVGVPAGDVDGDVVVLADVHREDLAALPVEDDGARGAAEAGEEIVLPSLVVVEPPDHPSPRERDVRLDGRLRQAAFASHLEKPPALVLGVRERNELDAVDHLLAPCARTKSLTA